MMPSILTCSLVHFKFFIGIVHGCVLRTWINKGTQQTSTEIKELGSLETCIS